jgi:broad specificity polyphosphatase/5'/3'-nucleotidase SurE
LNIIDISGASYLCPSDLYIRGTPYSCARLGVGALSGERRMRLVFFTFRRRLNNISKIYYKQ